MTETNSIVIRRDGDYQTVCKFFAPVEVGKNPRKLYLPPAEAERIALGTIEAVKSWRTQERNAYPPLDASLTKTALRYVGSSANIRPRGHIVVGVHRGRERDTPGGCVIPLLRQAFITPGNENAPSLLLHELAHLGGLGDTDEFWILIDPANPKSQQIECVGAAWRRITHAPLTYTEQGWEWDSENFVRKGHYFEEAMAQIVEIRILLEMDLRTLLDNPVICMGKEMVFEIPIEYGQSVAGWGAVLLESLCPGFMETLIDGARGQPDYTRLRGIIEAKFPGLFGELFDITKSNNLACGTEIILRRFT